ncbi:MAG: hypothetical protein Ta2D_11940 [Rickettsiales bacterium]|nr:MAG: hypothetical protein Ta2D_11940 [Rickettsiales bacterium]
MIMRIHTKKGLRLRDGNFSISKKNSNIEYSFTPDGKIYAIYRHKGIRDEMSIFKKDSTIYDVKLIKNEDLPPEIKIDKIKDVIDARCLYGNHEVDEQNLKEWRRIKRVFGNFLASQNNIKNRNDITPDKNVSKIKPLEYNPEKLESVKAQLAKLQNKQKILEKPKFKNIEEFFAAQTVTQTRQPSKQILEKTEKESNAFENSEETRKTKKEVQHATDIADVKNSSANTITQITEKEKSNASVPIKLSLAEKLKHNTNENKLLSR